MYTGTPMPILQFELDDGFLSGLRPYRCVCNYLYLCDYTSSDYGNWPYGGIDFGYREPYNDMLG